MRATAAIFVLTGFVNAAWATRIPAVADRLDLSAATLGVVLLCIEAGAIAGLAAGGALTTRLGTRRAVRLGFAAFPGALAAAGFAPFALLLASALFVMAAANSVVDVAMNAEGAALERRAGRPLLSRLHAGHSLGGLTGGGCGTLAAAAGVAPAAHLAGVAGVTLVLAQFAAGGFVAGPDGHAEAGARSGSIRSRYRGLGALGAIAFFAFLAEGVAADWSGVHLMRVHDAAPGLAAAAFTAFALALTVGRLAGDKVVAWQGRERVIRAGGILAAAGGALAVLSPSTAGALTGWAIAGLGVAPLAPAVIGAAAGAGNAGAASAVAAVSTLGYAGAFAGPPVVGGLATVAGLPTALATVSVAAAAAAALARRSR